jgi:hypothetical protein
MASIQPKSPAGEAASHAPKPEESWAPVLAYLIIHDLTLTEDGKPQNPVALFDRLHLRAALAETFSSLGLEGEQPWEMAARVRLLLTTTSAEEAASMHSASLWSESDARWLTGVTEHLGNTYINKERFEALLSWMQLPSILAAAQRDHEDLPQTLARISASATATKAAAAQAGYNLKNFLSPSTSRTTAETDLPQSADPVTLAVKLPASTQLKSSSNETAVEASLESSKV